MSKTEENLQNTDKWFEIKEKSAGRKRLEIIWFIYKYLGTPLVFTIAFFVSLITFLTNKDLRIYSKKYFEIYSEYTNDKKYRPSVLNIFRHILSYGYSLVDKMAVFGGRYKKEKVTFYNETDKKEMETSIKNGIFFICNHVGNIDIMRTFIETDKRTTTVFLQKNQCEIFNSFTEKISTPQKNLKTIPVEEIDITTAIELENDLKSGGISFMAGDRLSASQNDKTLEGKLLGKKVKLPFGVFKFSKLMPADIYFVSCLKEKGEYKIYLKKADKELSEEDIKNEFLIFTEEMILRAPYQFYHFYDYFMV